MFSILKPGKDPKLPLSCRLISLLDRTGKLFGKMLLTTILIEVSGRRVFRNTHFGFRLKHSTALQLNRLVERDSGNLDEKRLTGAVFLDVAKSFDSAWVDGLLSKLTFPLVPCENYLFLSAWSDIRSVLPNSQYTCRCMRASVAQGGIISPSCSVCM